MAGDPPRPATATTKSQLSQDRAHPTYSFEVKCITLLIGISAMGSVVAYPGRASGEGPQGGYQ
jgi:hypothetical protein